MGSSPSPLAGGLGVRVRGLPLATIIAALTGACTSHKDTPAHAKTLSHGDRAPRKPTASCSDCHAEHYGAVVGQHARLRLRPIRSSSPPNQARAARHEAAPSAPSARSAMRRLPCVWQAAEATPASSTRRPCRPRRAASLCYFCHSVVGRRRRRSDDPPRPRHRRRPPRGPISDPGRQRLRTRRRTRRSTSRKSAARRRRPSARSACHDVTIANGTVPIEQTFAEWKTALYAHDTKQTLLETCGGCHMPGTQGTAASPPNVVPTRTVHDHSVPGVDLARAHRSSGVDAQARARPERASTTAIGGAALRRSRNRSAASPPQ